MKRNQHGHTPAGWIGSGVVVLGFVVAGLGVSFGSVVVSIVGAVVTLLGVLTAVLLQKAGYGQYPPDANRRYASAQSYLGSRHDDPL